MAAVFGSSVQFAIDELAKIDQIANEIVNDAIERFGEEIQEFALESAAAKDYEALEKDSGLEDAFAAIRSALITEIFKSAARQGQATTEYD